MTLTTYSDPGAWVNGTTPLDATHMNGIRSFLIATGAMWDSNASWDGNGKLTLITLNATPTTTTLNGGTAGTALLIQDLNGTIKRVLVILSGFRTAGANQTIAIPVPFTKQCLVRAGNLGSATSFNGFQLLSSGVAQSVGIVTALASGGGTSSSVTTVFGNSHGECFHPVDTVQFVSGSSSNASGSFELVGE